MNPNASRLKELLAAHNAKKAQESTEKNQQLQQEAKHIPFTPKPPEAEGLTERQRMAVTLAEQGKEFCLIGAAGTGKTFTSAEVIQTLCKKLNIALPASVKDAEKIVVCAFTRRAVRNSAKNFRKIGAHEFCKTAHKALEYAPVYFDYEDENGEIKTTMRFEPQRTVHNPVLDCRLVIVEEASALGYDTLYPELRAAFPNATFIYIGDLNQLPPVFGDGVLGHKLNSLPVVELDKVFRTALENPIIKFAHEFTLKGKLPGDSQLAGYSKSSTPDWGLEFRPFKIKLDDPDLCSKAVADYIVRCYEEGQYDPTQDTILIPFNKAFGSIAVNREIAMRLDEKQKNVVWEIRAGISKKYFAVGDFVMHEKSECRITEICPNAAYSGQPTKPPSEHLDRNGHNRLAEKLNLNIIQEAGHGKLALKSFNAHLQAENKEETFNAASAIIALEDCDTGQEHTLSTAGEISSLELGYCMTVHKSQGSEWRRVWLVLHSLHATMLSRELFYTGQTRAREKLTVLYSPGTGIGKRNNTIARAISRPVVPGTSWQEKAKYFLRKSATPVT